MRVCTNLAFIFTVVFTGNAVILSQALARELTSSEMRAVSKVVNRLERHFPDPDTLFLGIGQSPEIFLADLQSRRGPENVFDVPLSAVRVLDFGLPGLLDAPLWGHFLTTHLNSVMAPSVWARSRETVVFDVARSGSSLQATKELFHAAYQAQGLDLSRLHFVALISESSDLAKVGPAADLILRLPRSLSPGVYERAYLEYHRYQKMFLFFQMQKYARLLDSVAVEDVDTAYREAVREQEIPTSAEKYQDLVHKFHQTHCEQNLFIQHWSRWMDGLWTRPFGR